MTPEELVAHRKRLGMNQTEMADALGLKPRGYQKLEAGESEIRTAYELAVDAISMRAAVERKQPMLAPTHIRRQAVELTKAVVGDDLAEAYSTMASLVTASLHQGATLRRERGTGNVTVESGLRRNYIPIDVLDILEERGLVKRKGESEIYVLTNAA